MDSVFFPRPLVLKPQNKHSKGSAIDTQNSAPAHPVRKLGPRLTHVLNWANERKYNHIWDLCCDHGRLGLHLHQLPPSVKRTIHLVDCVPSIIDKINRQYAASLGDNLVTQCIDAGSITLSDEELLQDHLFIIAGVGGETAIQITLDLLKQNPALLTNAEASAEFIFSPNGQAFELREYLQHSKFDCIAEAFVSDAGQHHEHIHIKLSKAFTQSSKISLLGHEIWAPLTQNKRSYLTKQQRHYQKCWELKGQKQASIAALGYLKILK